MRIPRALTMSAAVSLAAVAVGLPSAAAPSHQGDRADPPHQARRGQRHRPDDLSRRPAHDGPHEGLPRLVRRLVGEAGRARAHRPRARVHEIDETLTDPDLDGWYDRWFNENGDKCAWTYGPLHRTPAGAWTNVRLGGHDLLVQRNWTVAPAQGCAMAA